MSDLIQHFTYQFGITQVRCSPHHPESMLRAMVDDFQSAWCDVLPWALFAYREIPVETLGFNPFELMNGYPVRGPLCLVSSTWLQDSLSKTVTKQNVLQYILGMRQRISGLHISRYAVHDG